MRVKQVARKTTEPPGGRVWHPASTEAAEQGGMDRLIDALAAREERRGVQLWCPDVRYGEKRRSEEDSSLVPFPAQSEFGILPYAVWHGHLDTVRGFLRAGAGRDHRAWVLTERYLWRWARYGMRLSFLSMPDELAGSTAGRVVVTALQIAVYKRDTAAVKLLLQGVSEEHLAAFRPAPLPTTTRSAAAAAVEAAATSRAAAASAAAAAETAREKAAAAGAAAGQPEAADAAAAAAAAAEASAAQALRAAAAASAAAEAAEAAAGATAAADRDRFYDEEEEEEEEDDGWLSHPHLLDLIQPLAGSLFATKAGAWSTAGHFCFPPAFKYAAAELVRISHKHGGIRRNGRLVWPFNPGTLINLLLPVLASVAPMSDWLPAPRQDDFRRPSDVDSSGDHADWHDGGDI